MGDLEQQLEKQVAPDLITKGIEVHASTDELPAEILLQKERTAYERNELRERVNDRIAAREQRETYAKRTFMVVVGWISLSYLLLILQAVVSPAHFHPFSDKVLIALLTTTTANFLGMFIIVLKYIFRIPGETGDR